MISKNKKYLFCNAAAVLAIILFVAVFSFLSSGRHSSLKSYLNDLGTYDQIVWNTLKGDFFGNSANMLSEKNYLGSHFSPILLVFVPFYAVFASPKWLLFLQALAVGTGSIPIYLFAREKLKSHTAGLIFLLSFLSYPILHNSILYDFHEVVFAIPFASFAFYFLEKKNNKCFILFAALLSLSQEHLPLLVFMMGLYACFIQKRWKLGIIVGAASLSYFFLVMTVIMPFFSSTGNSALISGNSVYPSRYAWLGSSFSEIVKKIVSHPFGILFTILGPERLKFFFALLLPVLSLGLFSAPFLIALPVIFINFLSSNSMTYSIYFYHSAVIIPFIFFASVLTFKKWFGEDVFMRRIFLSSIILVSIGSCVQYTTLPLNPNYYLSDYRPDSHARKINEIVKIVPAGASLSVQHNLGPHFSERKKIYRFPIEMDKTDYIVLDQTDPYRSNPKQIFGFEYALQMGIDDWKNKIEELKKSENHDLIYDNDGYLVFKKK